MDFRVYLDGAQRIVSGVTPETTCKDIVLCLAQATQQFGKFILVERWRNNERLLNPNEYPIQVLSQWGEYAPDVVFIMKRCEPGLSESNIKLPTSASNHSLQLQRKQQILLQESHHHQNRPYQSDEPSSGSTRVNHQSNRVEGKQLKPMNLNVENDHYGSCQPPKHVYYQEEKLINTPCKSSSQPNPSSNTIPPNHPTDLESDYGTTNPALAKRPKHPPPYYEAITKSSLLRSSPSDPVEASSETSGKNWPQGEAGNSSFRSKEANRSSFYEETSEDSQRPAIRVSRNSEESKTIKENCHPEETKLNDVKLSNLQKDTLNANNRQILEITSPINYWNSNNKSSASKPNNVIPSHQKQAEGANGEPMDSPQPEVTAGGNIEMIENLNEELSRINLGSRSLEVDKGKLRIQLSEIENQIADCRHSIEQLMDQISHLNMQKEEEELLKRREEESIKSQLIEITKGKSVEFERQSEQLRLVDVELKESDEMLKERIKKIEKILHDLKEANLQGLSLLPRDELFTKNSNQMKTSQSHVIINPDARNSFHAKQQRPGSTRKMFVPPRELKNAVATSKNPHGVWV